MSRYESIDGHRHDSTHGLQFLVRWPKKYNYLSWISDGNFDDREPVDAYMAKHHMKYEKNRYFEREDFGDALGPVTRIARRNYDGTPDKIVYPRVLTDAEDRLMRRCAAPRMSTASGKMQLARERKCETLKRGLISEELFPRTAEGAAKAARECNRIRKSFRY